MKITFQILIALTFIGESVFGGDVQNFVRAAAKDIPDNNVIIAEVRKIEAIMPRDQLVKELVEELMGAENPVTEVVVNTMLLGMEPFPFLEIREQLTPEAGSTKRAYLLFLLNKGASAPGQVDDVLEVAKSMLSDKGKGIRRYGEARTYSADGLRVCDMAYNVLVTRLPLNPTMMPVDTDNFVPDMRDALILELAERASIRLTADNPNAAGSKLDAPETGLNEPKLSPTRKAPEVKPAPPPNEEPTSSTPWSIIVVLIVAALSLLWLLLKRRS